MHSVRGWIRLDHGGSKMPTEDIFDERKMVRIAVITFKFEFSADSLLGFDFSQNQAELAGRIGIRSFS